MFTTNADHFSPEALVQSVLKMELKKKKAIAKLSKYPMKSPEETHQRMMSSRSLFLEWLSCFLWKDYKQDENPVEGHRCFGTVRKRNCIIGSINVVYILFFGCH